MRRIMNIVRRIINNIVVICKAIRRKQLSKKKTIDIISAPENELNAFILKYYDDTEEAQKVIDLHNKRRQEHEDVIRKVIAVLKKEGLIKSHIKVELSGDNRNYHQREICEIKDMNLLWSEDTIHVSYGVDDDFNAFLDRYIDNTFGKAMWPDSNTHYMFTFLHEFGHYVDSTLAHEESYERMNQELKKDIDSNIESKDILTIDDWEEAQLAYRKVPCEAFADKWAIDFMYKHFPEEFYEEELSEC